MSDSANHHKRQMSCNGCRQRKMKCNRELKCSSCIGRGVPCVWMNGGPPPPKPEETALQEAIRELRELRTTVASLQSRLSFLEGASILPQARSPTPSSQSRTPPYSYEYREEGDSWSESEEHPSPISWNFTSYQFPSFSVDADALSHSPTTDSTSSALPPSFQGPTSGLPALSPMQESRTHQNVPPFQEFGGLANFATEFPDGGLDADLNGFIATGFAG